PLAADQQVFTPWRHSSAFVLPSTERSRDPGCFVHVDQQQVIVRGLRYSDHALTSNRCRPSGCGLFTSKKRRPPGQPRRPFLLNRQRETLSPAVWKKSLESRKPPGMIPTASCTR